MKSIYTTNLTVVSLPNARWAKVVTKTGQIQTAGSCYNYAEYSLAQIKEWFERNTTDPELKRLGYFIEAYRASKGSEHSPLPTLFQQGLEKWRSGGKLDELKKSLPAFVPSIQFTPESGNHELRNKPNGTLYSNKAMVARDPDSWKHTGILGIDIDLGKAHGNPDDPKVLWEKARPMKDIDGFLFMYASPSGGAKAFFQLDDTLVSKLNASPTDDSDRFDILANRISLHKLCYFTLARRVAQETGLEVDTVCNDPARLQFMYRALQGYYLFNESDGSADFSIPDLLKAQSDMETMLRGSKDTSSLVRPLIVSELPDTLIKFVAWLRENTYNKEADGILALRPEGEHWYGYCPCCEKLCTTPRADRDLRMTINAEDPRDVRFHCFHSTCFDLRKLRTPMWRLWQMYLDDIESQVALATADELNISSDLRNILQQRVEAMRQINADGGMQNNSLYTMYFNVARAINAPYPDVKCDKDGNPVAPYPSFANFKVFLKYGFNVQPIFNLAMGANQIMNLNTGGLYDLEERLISHLRTSWQSVSNLPLTSEACHTYVDAIAIQYHYHPLIALSAGKEWDGIDRLTPFLHSLPVDPTRLLDGISPEDWRDRVLKCWLTGIYRRLRHIWNENYTNVTQNYMPIFSGGQGVGKNKWIEHLFSLCKECFALDVRLDSQSTRDTEYILATTNCVHIDEVDRYTLNYKLCNELKSYITKTWTKNRFAYQKSTVQRHAVAAWIGSTNQDQLLTDETGNRRFYVIYLDDPGWTTDEKWANVSRFQSLDVQQIWAQIKYMVDTDEVPYDEWKTLGAITTRNNELNAMESSGDEYLLDKLRPIYAGDIDMEGKPLINHVPAHYTKVENILRELRDSVGRSDAISYQSARRFASDMKKYWGSEYKARTYLKGNVPRIRAITVETWLEFAHDSVKKHWYKLHPEDEETDKNYKSTTI